MIQKECFEKEWIDKVCSSHKFKHPELVEKVIRAFSLLEMLVKEGCPLTFKGGTSLLLILGNEARRLSIDIDVLCPPGTDIEQYLQNCDKYGFTDCKVIRRENRNSNIPKGHYKSFFEVVYSDQIEDSVLLDVLYEDNHYHKIEDKPLSHPFIQTDGSETIIHVPSVADMLGDKLTAFAPNTCGVPYYKGTHNSTINVAKQLHDVGRLFDVVDDIATTAETFKSIAVVELSSYRGKGEDLSIVYDDIRNTALALATREKVDPNKDFELLKEGVDKLKSHIYVGRYTLDMAISDAAKAAYLATVIQYGLNKIEKYSGNAADVKDMTISPVISKEVAKIRRGNPEAYFYWCKTSQILHLNLS
jgi:predicted nucleotidyltransferase component of viral defense system